MGRVRNRLRLTPGETLQPIRPPDDRHVPLPLRISEHKTITAVTLPINLNMRRRGRGRRYQKKTCTRRSMRI
jgi:hypothetical protein